MDTIMSNLPNHLIMNIIKLADGGLNTHKSKLKLVFEDLLAPGWLDDWYGNHGDSYLNLDYDSDDY